VNNNRNQLVVINIVWGPYKIGGIQKCKSKFPENKIYQCNKVYSHLMFNVIKNNIQRRKSFKQWTFLLTLSTEYWNTE